MNQTIHRSIAKPVRTGLSWHQAWMETDRGLIKCWEKGRELQKVRPILTSRAARGELIPLPWKGGVEWKLAQRKKGSLQYLAMWQGLRNEDLHVSLAGNTELTCSRTGQIVFFAAHHFEPDTDRPTAPRRPKA